MAYSILTTDFKTQSDLIDRLYHFFKPLLPLEDFTIFTDEVIHSSSEYSMLTTFYMIAYKGAVIFLSLDDYMEYGDTTSGEKIVYIPNDKIHLIDRSMIKNFTIVTEIDNKLRWMKNNEL